MGSLQSRITQQLQDAPTAPDSQPALTLETHGVSVVIPAWNATSTLAETLSSVLSQDYEPVEILVVDDGSTDGTPELVAAIDDDRLRCIRSPERNGPGHARNVGMREARGKYVAFLDADDLWLPGKLKLQVELLEQHPEFVLVSCNSGYLTEDGKHLRWSHESRPPVGGREAWKTLLAYNFTPTSTVLARREELLEKGGFPEHLEIGEDLDLWIRLALVGEIGVVDQPLVNIREWSGSHTSRCGHSEADLVVPLVESFVEEHRGELSKSEVREILGRRYHDSAISLLYTGRPAKSLRYFMRAARQGYSGCALMRCLPRVLLSFVTGGRYPRRYH